MRLLLLNCDVWLNLGGSSFLTGTPPPTLLGILLGVFPVPETGIIELFWLNKMGGNKFLLLYTETTSMMSRLQVMACEKWWGKIGMLSLREREAQGIKGTSNTWNGEVLNLFQETQGNIVWLGERKNHLRIRFLEYYLAIKKKKRRKCHPLWHHGWTWRALG